jgi:hypothetical protein
MHIFRSSSSRPATGKRACVRATAAGATNTDARVQQHALIFMLAVCLFSDCLFSVCLFSVCLVNIPLVYPFPPSASPLICLVCLCPSSFLSCPGGFVLLDEVPTVPQVLSFHSTRYCNFRPERCFFVCGCDGVYREVAANVWSSPG